MHTTVAAARRWSWSLLGVLGAAFLLVPRLAAQTVTPIATIQADPNSFVDQVVTVEGQVYIPANYRGTLYSGYIQDSSNRGINLFGGTANNPLLFDVGNIVRVTGTVAIFQTTVEITNLTSVTLVSSGNPPLQPRHLNTGGANSRSWVGTFMAVPGPNTANPTTPTTTPPATNYTVNDGSGPTVIRVVNSIGASDFAIGQTITGRGAGSLFGTSTYQILVGRGVDVVLGSGGDTTPPALTGAIANSATQISVSFNERVTAATAQSLGNYAVFETATPANTVPVTGATLEASAQSVTLELGASLQNGVDYTVRVNNVQDEAGNPIAANTTRTFTWSGGGDTTPPALASASASSATQAVVGFSEPVTAATAEVVGNYALFETLTPANTVSVTGATLAGNALSVTLSLGASLQDGIDYTVRVNNVQDEAGNPIAANSTRTFTYSAVQVTPIATIQANPSAFDGQVVTVEGQVYVPANYRAPTYSGYIQDSSNRGINLFGSTANNALLNDVGNIVRVTGTVDIFFTTIEITNLTAVTLVSSGNPPLQPQQLGTGAAASTAWEGTFIEATGTITAATPSGPGTNYTINDGSGNLDVRVVDALGVAPFTVGQSITGRGAGAQFQTTFQILIGRPSDVFLSGGDTTPPTLTGATTPSATQVAVSFSERVTAATAQVVGNYAVFETATPGNTIAVTGATPAGNALSVNLALGASLQSGINYTVQVNNVEDEAGNTIAANSTRTFTYSAVQVTPIATIQANPSAFDGQVVTVEGQVYVPCNYRGTLFSGYIQDGSGRGINLFGNTTNNPLLFDISNVVRVTGTVDIFQTTVEITNLTNVTLLSSGNQPLQPRRLSTQAANSSGWEGTFIEVTGAITAVARTETSTPPATNYTVNDGTGATIVRVVDTINATSFVVGQTITGRGAGSLFGTSTYQILVGGDEDVFVAAGPEGGGALALSGPPFTFIPTVGETYPIGVTVPVDRQARSEVLLRVFDLQGRLRRTLADSRFGPVLQTVPWNGRDDAAELVPAGSYVVHLLVTDTQTGSRETLQMAVVVATRLQR